MKKIVDELKWLKNIGTSPAPFNSLINSHEQRQGISSSHLSPPP